MPAGISGSLALRVSRTIPVDDVIAHSSKRFLSRRKLTWCHTKNLTIANGTIWHFEFVGKDIRHVCHWFIRWRWVIKFYLRERIRVNTWNRNRKLFSFQRTFEFYLNCISVTEFRFCFCSEPMVGSVQSGREISDRFAVNKKQHRA